MEAAIANNWVVYLLFVFSGITAFLLSRLFNQNDAKNEVVDKLTIAVGVLSETVSNLKDIVVKQGEYIEVLADRTHTMGNKLMPIAYWVDEMKGTNISNDWDWKPRKK